MVIWIVIERFVHSYRVLAPAPKCTRQRCRRPQEPDCEALLDSLHVVTSAQWVYSISHLLHVIPQSFRRFVGRLEEQNYLLVRILVYPA